MNGRQPLRGRNAPDKGRIWGCGSNGTESSIQRIWALLILCRTASDLKTPPRYFTAAPKADVSIDARLIAGGRVFELERNAVSRSTRASTNLRF